VLTCHDVSSLVVDRLCDQARGQNTVVLCFYFDFFGAEEVVSHSHARLSSEAAS